MQHRQLQTPLTEDVTRSLKAGELVLLSGVVYAARDAAHMRIKALLAQGLPPPFALRDAVIYYTGPSPTPPGRVIGSAGPTTAYRMDSFTPELHKAGLAATIGKGRRSPEVRQALAQYGRVYFGATGGAGALLAEHITACAVIAFPELGPEAIRRLILKDLPLLVVYDSHNGSIYP